MTTRTKLAAICLSAALLGGCSSDSSFSRSGDETIGGGRFVRSSDTFGTGRRMDVYGGATAPVLPSIGAPGYGK